ncbi:MAG: NmrA/HSCARG family protein [Bryobacteraceae bacterium]
MQGKRIIAVVGATGAQGGSLVRAILNDPEGGYSVRALTRNPSSPKAQELAQQGAAVVQADLDDPGSLTRAFDGAYGAFCVTNFWEHFSPERETAQAANMAAAAKAAGLRHVIWSTLEDTRKWVPLEDNRMPTLMGQYKVPHFDAKGQADRFFIEAGLPVTLLLTSFYFENFIYFGMGPRRTPNGKLVIAFPMGNEKLPGIAVEDIGKCAYGISRSGSKFAGKTVGVAAEHLTGAEMAAALSRALGAEVVYEAMDPEAYRNLGLPGAQDIGNMFQFNRDFSADFCEARSIELSRRLNPSLQTFDAWLEVNKSRIPIA